MIIDGKINPLANKSTQLWRFLMKKWFLYISYVAITCAFLFALDQHQGGLVEKGDLVILNSVKGVFADGPIFIDKIQKTITSKASVFPVVLWEDKAGKIFVQYHMIQYRAYLVYNKTANKEEIAFYRSYFPHA